MSKPVRVLPGREVSLGDAGAFTVRRTLPHRDRAFVGAWCFADHYGPAPVTPGGGMDVAPHPHTGLQTVSWLFSGELEHRDSAGNVAAIRPGEVNLMTAGAGIAHSETSVAATGDLHGVQLWVALPDSHRHTGRAFVHHEPPTVALADAAGSARVFVGTLAGVDASPVPTFTPLLGAQLDLAPDADVTLRIEPGFEHGVLLDAGALALEGSPLAPGDLGCLDAGSSTLRLTAGPDGARAILLGGEPFEEDLVMWWNFVGRSHEEIVAFRAAWEAASERFGTVPGYVGAVERLPAPALPALRLIPRRHHTRV